MPLPLAVAPLAAVLVAIGLFFLIRWWLDRTGAALLFTLSLLLNFTIFMPVALGIMASREIQDFQAKMPTTQKLVLVEQGSNILLAVTFTDIKSLDSGLSSFKPLPPDQVQRIAATQGDARYLSLTKDYYKVFVVERDFLQKIASPDGASPSPSQTPQAGQKPSGQTTQQDNTALQNLLTSARDALAAGDLNKLATTAADLQKAYQDGGMSDAAAIAGQIQQAAKAKDMNALAALAPKIAQLAASGGAGPALQSLSGAPSPILPISADIIMKAIDSDDPAKVLLPYLPQQSIQEMGGGDPARLKLMMIAYLLENRFQNGIDPLFILSEYHNGDLQVYPDTSTSFILKLLPLELPGNLINIKP